MSAMTNTNWPDPTRPGVPLFPERDGWHAIGLTIKQVKWWDAANKYWWDSERRYYLTLDEVAFRVPEYRYHGTVLSPMQINEMLAAERERCAIVCENQKPSEDNASRSICLNSRWHTASQCAANIRNLGAAP